MLPVLLTFLESVIKKNLIKQVFLEGDVLTGLILEQLDLLFPSFYKPINFFFKLLIGYEQLSPVMFLPSYLEYLTF